jgi:hypothetical protein
MHRSIITGSPCVHIALPFDSSQDTAHLLTTLLAVEGDWEGYESSPLRAYEQEGADVYPAVLGCDGARRISGEDWRKRDLTSEKTAV